MAGFDAPAGVPAGNSEPEDTFGTACGRVLFVVYLILYCGYVFVTAFAPELMERTPFGGINLSVLYGLGLIATAIIMAILYDWLCQSPAQSNAKSDREDRP